MKSFSDIGFVLKIYELPEASKLISVWCKRFGKKMTIAKGAGKILSRKGGSLDLLNLAKFSFHQGRTYALITEVELQNDYHTLKEDLKNISNVFYLLDILNHFLPEEETTSALFDEFLNFLELYLITQQNHELLIAAFELKILSYFGFEPFLEKCLHCQKPLQPDTPRIAATAGQAGYLCYKHFSPKEFQQFLVNDTIIKLQKYLNTEPLTQILNFAYDAKLWRRLRNVHKTWIEGILEQHLKSNVFKDQIK